MTQAEFNANWNLEVIRAEVIPSKDLPERLEVRANIINRNDNSINYNFNFNAIVPVPNEGLTNSAHNDLINQIPTRIIAWFNPFN